MVFDGVFTLFVMNYYKNASTPIKPWSLYLNFNHNHQAFQLLPEHFTSEGDNITSLLIKQIEEIDPKWKVKGNEPIFEEVSTKKRLKINEHISEKHNLQAIIDSIDKPHDITFFQVMDQVFGVNYERENSKFQQEKFNLRNLLKKDFGIDFPILGGTGNSRDNPIIIQKIEPNDYISIEYKILHCLGEGRRVKWRILQQVILHHNDRTLDQIKIEVEETNSTEIVTTTENYYFDITECVDF